MRSPKEALEPALEQVRKRLRLLLDQINKNETAKSMITAWIDKYDGKIIEFQVFGWAFHLVFTKERVAFEEDSYSSPDVIIAADPNLTLDILSGKIKPSTLLVTSGKLQVWGNFHELVSFSKIVSFLGTEE